MGNHIKFIIPVAIIAIVSGCNSKYQSEDSKIAQADSSISAIVSSSATRQNENDPRKFIRTADLRFKVDNVITATYTIEDVVNKNNGYVTYTSLTNNINNTENVQISPDSILQTTHYSLTNDITLRIPNNKLDTTLKSIASLISFIGHRVITCEDVSLQQMNNSLTQKRTTEHFSRLSKAIDNKGKKLEEIVTAEDSYMNKHEQADEALIANLTLDNNVNLSTVKISLYQNESVKTELLPIAKIIKPYQPPFFQRAAASLQTGWYAITEIFLGLISIWPLYLLCAIAYVVYKKYKPIKAKVTS